MIERNGRAARAKLKRYFPGGEDPLLLSALEGFAGRCLEDSGGDSAIVESRGFVFLSGQARERFFRAAAAGFSPGFLTFCGSPAWLSAARRWGAAFVPRCLDKGLIPHGDAMTKARRNLALQLGFVNPRAYRAVCREEKPENAR